MTRPYWQAMAEFRRARRSILGHAKEGIGLAELLEHASAVVGSRFRARLYIQRMIDCGDLEVY